MESEPNPERRTSFSKTTVLCDCGWLERAASDPATPIAFDLILDAFCLRCGAGGGARAPLYHCPFCGGAAPKSQRLGRNTVQRAPTEALLKRLGDSSEQLLNPLKCRVLPEAALYGRKEVQSLHYDGVDLTIEIQGDDFGTANVVFQGIVGFRVLEERDLGEFPSPYSQPQDWLYEVDEGGWLELESHRPEFNSPGFMGERLREFLVVDEMCIGVLTCDPPEIERTGGAVT